MAIEAAHYQETRDALIKDPVIQAMAEDMEGVLDWDSYLHASGRPNFNFMLGALKEYKRRGGTIQTHIGGPAESILIIVKESAP